MNTNTNFNLIQMNLSNSRHSIFITVLFGILILFTQFGFVACNSSKNRDTNENEDSKGKKVAKQSTESESSGTALKPDAFWDAALNGNLEAVSSMLKLGMDVNVADEDGRTAIMFAGFNGHTEVVKILIDRGAKVDAFDNSHRTALLFAATGPFPETVKLLLDNKSNPNVVDNGEHFSPLMHAAAEGNLEIVKILLDYGARMDLKDVDGDTAETFARQKGHTALADYLKSMK